MSQSFQFKQSFQAGGVRCEKLSDALLYMVVRDDMPLMTPDKPGFKYFASVATPNWKPPGRKALTERLDKKYSAAIGPKKLLFKDKYMCTTTDAWTDTHTNRAYLGMTVHYVQGLQLKTEVLGLLKLEGAHDTVNLSAALRMFLSDWDISLSQVSGTVCDNANNMKAGVKSAFGESKLIPCFAHTLNLTVQDALGSRKENDKLIPNVPGIPGIISLVSAIVEKSNRSVKFSDAIREAQIRAGIQENNCLLLIKSVVTRWNSTYFMLKRFLTLFEYISLLTYQGFDIVLPSPTEMITLKSIMTILEPFHYATAEMSEAKHTTLSRVIPITKLIRDVSIFQLFRFLVHFYPKVHYCNHSMSFCLCVCLSENSLLSHQRS